jgi:hypothetical protein
MLIGIQGARTFGAPAAKAKATRTHTAVKIALRVLDGAENVGFGGVGTTNSKPVPKPDITVVAEAATGDAAVRAALSLRPDVVQPAAEQGPGDSLPSLRARTIWRCPVCRAGSCGCGDTGVTSSVRDTRAVRSHNLRFRDRFVPQGIACGTRRPNPLVHASLNLTGRRHERSANSHHPR